MVDRTKERIVKTMAKKDNARVPGMKNTGSTRKRKRKKGNRPGKTLRCGNGKRVRT